MGISEKVAYLKGLMEGMNLNADSNEGKLFLAIADVLDEIALEVEDLTDEVMELGDGLDVISDDLGDVEDIVYDEDEDDYEDEEDDEDDEDEDEDDEEDADDANDDDIASEPFYEVACPNCGETVYVSEDDLDAGEANCAHCGVTFEVALEGDEEEPDEDAPVQYEVTCPDCGTTAVFEEEELLEGEPKCPNCGKPLDFEVTEE